MQINKKLISIIIPVLNESENINPFYESILPVINSCSDKYEFEILFTDNHSSDDTFEKISLLCMRDKRVKVIRFSRNFGYQKSILTGYLNAAGDALIQIDCDLQDPLELIVDFLTYWEDGNLVVYGIRRSRKDSFILHSARKIFYRLINYLSDYDLPLDAGDFRLIDKKIVGTLRQMDDAHPYIRGSIAGMGFKQIGIPYDRIARARGYSKFNFNDLITLSLDGILNHSIKPLRLASIFGLFISVITLAMILIYSLGRMYFGLNWPSGFTTITVITLFGISINSLFLGIIGEYLGRIYQQTKKKPLTIIEKVCGYKDLSSFKINS
jgi:dolichol-phosphate mannosyltransferase